MASERCAPSSCSASSTTRISGSTRRRGSSASSSWVAATSSTFSSETASPSLSVFDVPGTALAMPSRIRIRSVSGARSVREQLIHATEPGVRATACSRTVDFP
jgi:hypothetical protein